MTRGLAAKDYANELFALLKHENPEVRQSATWGAPRVFADDQLAIAAPQHALEDNETAEEAAKSLKLRQEARP